jgi:predicted dithiol-disulfide oxidoreductase (DUF899 family)
MNVVSRDEWLVARKALLAKEKAFTRQRDALSAERRALPAVKIDKGYVFDGANGTATLPELFDGRGQLLVYHFMYGTDWDEGCPSCSFWADNFNGIDIHLAHRDITLVLVAKAPYATLAAYQERMGWSVPFYSAADTTFNEDFDVTYTAAQQEAGADYNYKIGNWKFGSDSAGASAFLKADDGSVLHTYSTFSRGLDILNGAYNLMDIMPKGRDEAGLEPHSMAWLRRRDQYED